MSDKIREYLDKLLFKPTNTEINNLDLNIFLQ